MKRIISVKVLIAMLACVLIMKPPLVQAAPVTFSFNGMGSGNLDTTVFTSAEFEVLISADTDDVQPYPRLGVPDPTTPCIIDLSGTIHISGIGIGSFVEPLYVFDNHGNSTVGFGNWTTHDLINLTMVGAGLDTYNLTTSFGPITELTPWFNRVSVELSIGDLTFSDMSHATFTANVIPEPATLLLLGSGVVMARRKR